MGQNTYKVGKLKKDLTSKKRGIFSKSSSKTDIKSWKTVKSELSPKDMKKKILAQKRLFINQYGTSNNGQNTLKNKKFPIQNGYQVFEFVYLLDYPCSFCKKRIHKESKVVIHKENWLNPICLNCFNKRTADNNPNKSYQKTILRSEKITKQLHNIKHSLNKLLK